MSDESRQQFIVSEEKAIKELASTFRFVAAFLAVREVIDIVVDGHTSRVGLLVIACLLVYAEVVLRLLAPRRIRKLHRVLCDSSPKEMKFSITPGYFGKEIIRLMEIDSEKEETSYWNAKVAMPSTYRYSDYMGTESVCKTYFDSDSAKPMFIEFDGSLLKLDRVGQVFSMTLNK